MESTSITNIIALPLVAIGGFALNNSSNDASALNQRYSYFVFATSSTDSPNEDTVAYIPNVRFEEKCVLDRVFDDFLEQPATEMIKDIKRIINDVEEDDDLYDDFIEFIKEKSDTIVFESAIVRFFNEDSQYSKKVTFLNMILSSDINIFCNWFENILNISKLSPNRALSRRANDILNYYSEAFNKVNGNNLLR